MRLEPYREAWQLILPKESNHVMDIHASADSTFVEACHSDPELCHSDRRKEPAVGLHHPNSDHLLKIYRNLIRNTPAITVEPSLASWPIPQLKILVARDGKRLLRQPGENPREQPGTGRARLYSRAVRNS